MKPKLQIALDVTSTQQALDILSLNNLVDEVDIIEAGTVLLAADGASAPRRLREKYPTKMLVADFKIADAVNTIGGMLFDAGANLITVIAAADLATMEIAGKLAKKYDQHIQIELYGRWDFDLARAWFKGGADHIIYHHSRDASQAWTDTDIEKIKGLIEIGFHVSVTGGLKPEDIAMFGGLEIYSFIVGRSLYEAQDPVAIARAFKQSIDASF
jgi:3-dehydro-L-gulonate-6-phosphate decarboxylase